MARQYGKMTLDDPMERLLNTVQVMAQFQNTLTNAREAKERTDIRRMESIQTGWTAMFENIDWQDVDPNSPSSIINTQGRISAQANQYMSQYPSIHEDINASYQILNSSISKGLKHHQDFDVAHNKVQDILINAEPLLTEFYNEQLKYPGGLMPYDEKEKFKVRTREVTKDLVSSIAKIDGFKTTLPNKYSSVYDDLMVASSATGVMLSQFGEFLDEDEKALLTRAYKGEIKYNEFESAWKDFQGNELNHWNNNKGIFHTFFEDNLHEWEYRNDFLTRWEDGTSDIGSLTSTESF